MLPEAIRLEIQGKLWKLADDLDWQRLPQSTKAKYYRSWTEDREIGGVLGRYMDPRKVRVYLKDTLLKPYNRAKHSDPRSIYALLHIDQNSPVRSSYEKPHGRLLRDGRVIGWGLERNWKAVIMSVFERAYVNGGTAYGVVLLGSAAHIDPQLRALATAAADRLGIEKLIWA